MSSDILIGKHRIPIYQTQIATFCFEFAIEVKYYGLEARVHRLFR